MDTTAWCPECRTRQPITEQFLDAYYTASGEAEFQVTVLGCDHTLESHPKIIGPAPGAPYAGGVTSPTAKAKDLRAAAQREAVLADPWLA